MRKYRKRKGRCYELAWKHLLYDEEFAGWLLVHGEMSGFRGQARIGHASLEKDDQVFDPVENQFFSKEDYRSRFDAIARVSYTQEEAGRIGAKAGHAGPWDRVPGHLLHR
jgi:hypothetical protein